MPCEGASDTRTLRGNHRVVHLVAHVGANVGHHLPRQAVARIEHRQHDAVDGERGIERAPHLIDGGQQLGQAFEREELALQRHDHGVCRGERIDRQQVERWRAVDKHVGDRLGTILVGGEERLERLAELVRPVAVAGDFQLDPEQVHGRGRDAESRHRGRRDDVAQGAVADERVVARGHPAFAVDSEARRSVALRIEVDDQDALADRGQSRAEIDGGGGLADAPLLVGHDEHAGAMLRRDVFWRNDGSHLARLYLIRTLKDRGAGVADARDRLDRIALRRGVLLQVPRSRLSAWKQPDRSALQPWCGEFERLRQGGKGARGDAVHSCDGFGRQRLDPDGVDVAGARSRAPPRAGRRNGAGRCRRSGRRRLESRRAGWRQSSRESPRPSPCRANGSRRRTSGRS